MKELYRLNPYLWKYRWKLILGIVFVIVSNYFQILQPQEVRKALDSIIEYLKNPEGRQEALYDGLFMFGLLILGYSLLMGIFMFFMRQTIIVMSRQIEYDMREDIFAHFTTLDPDFFKKNKTGDLLARIVEDVSKVRMYLGPAILYAANILTLTVLTVYSMFKVNSMLAFWSLLPLPILSVSIYYVSNIINKQSTKIQQQLSVLNNITQEVFSGIRVVKAYNREPEISKYFEKETEKYQSLNLSLALTDSLFSPLMFLIIGSSTLLTVYLGGLEVIAGRFTTGNIAEFIIYISKLTWPVTSAGWIASLVQQAAASQKRINEFMDQEPTIVQGDHSIFSVPDIEIENLKFTYPRTNESIFESINLSIPFGSKVAIFGKTGSGKTTLADLLVRQYDPDSGVIKIGGVNIKEIKADELAAKIGYIPQDVFLFSDTVENNISYASNEMDLNSIQKFASFAAIHEEILSLPNGYTTQIGERGVMLSGGQKQRISIARAMAKRPEILILDDSLSAVDARTEHEISEILNQEFNNTTLICITHRIFSTIQFDQIIVLESGRIVEKGTHSELIANESGFYFQLWQHSKT